MTLPVDSAARDRALDPETSFIVQAPAGSGKTGLLIRRFLLLLGRVESPEEILAITFTRKATAEMHQRIVNALAGVNEAGEPETDEQLIVLAQTALANDHSRGWQLLNNTRRLRIQTIDSFCSELVHRMPWSSRFGSAPSILEDAENYYLQAARNTVAHIEDGDTSLASACGRLVELMNADVGMACELLTRMLKTRDKWMRLLDGYQRKRLEGWWQLTIAETLADCDKLFSHDEKQEIVALAQFAGQSLIDKNKNTKASSLIEACAEMTEFPAPTADNIALWRGIATLLLTAKMSLRIKVDARSGFPTTNKPIKNRMLELLQSYAGNLAFERSLAKVGILPERRYSDLQWQTIDSLLTLLPVAAAELKLLFSENNRADYIELAQRAEQALGQADAPSDLALVFDYQLKHLLVDEFQDTSKGQLELFEKLLSGWQPGDGRTAFFVGDPMQSIYRFREAEVGNFIDVASHGIADVIPEPLLLETNFRSDSHLIDWFNQAFTEVMPDQTAVINGAISYSPASGFWPRQDNCGVQIHASVDSKPQPQLDEIVDLVIDYIHKEPHQSIAILGRTRNSLHPIVTVLQQRGIAFQGINLQKLRERQAIQDLLGITSALAQPSDRAAWLGLMRGPWCGMTLSEISIVCGDDLGKSIIACWQDETKLCLLSAETQLRLKKLIFVITEALGRRGRIALWKNLEATWLSLGGPAGIDNDDLENCQRFIHLIAQMEHEEIAINIFSLDKAIENLWASSVNQATVQLLTIHGAKGLEFDTVILPDLHRQSKTSDPELLRIRELPDRLLVAPRPPSENKEELFYRFLGELEREHLRNESSRLLYVACTRARRRLHLFGNIGISSAGELKEPASTSLLALLWPVVKPEFIAVKEQTINEPISNEKEIGETIFPLERFAGNWTLPALPDTIKSTTSSINWLDEASEVEFDWAGEAARLIGIVIHQEFQQIESIGWERWKQREIGSKEQLQWRNRLIENGVPQEMLVESVAQISDAVTKTKTDENASWIFSNAHSERQVEWRLSGVIEQKIVHVVIDRSFVDQDNVRWVIDFKSSRHDNPHDLDIFLARERERYQEQLGRYAILLSALEGREVRTALYYPLFKRLEKL